MNRRTKGVAGRKPGGGPMKRPRRTKAGLTWGTAGTTARLRLTRNVVERAEPMEGGRQKVYFDTALAGFGVVVGKTAKTFFAQGAVRGKNKNRRVTIGRYPTMSVDRARREAQVELGKMGQGEDPAETRLAEERERDARRAEAITLGAAVELYLAAPKMRTRSPRTVEGYRWAAAKYFAGWRDTPLSEITPRMARERHLEIGSRHGTYAANGAMRLFRAVWNRAVRQHQTLPTNPVVNVDWFVEHRRDAALAPEELRAWHAEVLAMKNPIRRDYLIFVLFTGLRRRSAAGVEWAHVDLDSGTLLVPKPKGGESRAFTLPLSNHVVELLRRRRKEDEPFYPGSKWAFPAESASGHIEEPKPNAGEKFSVKVTVHGLRHLYISAATEAGVSPYPLKLLTNHKLPKGDVTAGYVHLDAEALRPEQQRVTDHLLRRVKPDPGGEEVVPDPGGEKVVRLKRPA